MIHGAMIGLRLAREGLIMWKYHSTCTMEPATESEEAHHWVTNETEEPQVPAHPEPKAVVRRNGPRQDDLAVFGLLDDRAIARPASLRTFAELTGRPSLGAIGLSGTGRPLATASPRELLGMLGLEG
jgi:hypothetical protein